MLFTKRLFVLTASIFIGASTLAFTQDLLLEGKISANPVLINIPCETANECDGMYYYKDELVCAEVNMQNDSINLIAKKERWDNSREVTFRIVKQGDRWSGTFLKKDTAVNFQLNEIDLQAVSHRYEYLPAIHNLFEANPFLYVITAKKKYNLKINGRNFKFDSLDTHVKHILENIAFGEVVSKLKPACEGSYDSEISEASICNHILSFQISANWDGGAHPDFGTTIYQIDLKKKQAITIEDIVDVERLKPEIIHILSKIPEQYKKLEGEGCNYLEGDVLHPSGFSCKGICIGAYFARVERACDDPCIATIPFNVLAKYGYLKADYLFLSRK